MTFFKLDSSLRFRRNDKAFTLIEILTTVAILAILSAIVLVSLNGARIRGRDVKRVADIKQIQQALENYFDVCYSYPLGFANGPGYFNGVDCKGNVLIPSMPKDPVNKLDYFYSVSSVPGSMFFLCAILENPSNVPKSKANIMNYPCGCSYPTCTESNKLIYDVTGGNY